MIRQTVPMSGFELHELFASSASVQGAEAAVNGVRGNVSVQMSDTGSKPDVDFARWDVHS